MTVTRDSTTHTRNALLNFHCNNGYANALQNYVIPTKLIFFILQSTGKCFFMVKNEILDGDEGILSIFTSLLMTIIFLLLLLLLLSSSLSSL